MWLCYPYWIKNQIKSEIMTSFLLIYYLLLISESQKAHISSHNEFQKLHNPNFADVGPTVLQEGLKQHYFLPSHISSFEKNNLLTLTYWSNINICHKFTKSLCRKPWFPMKDVMESTIINLEIGCILLSKRSG